MIQLPANISDLAAWLLLPAVLGIIATFIAGLVPAKYEKYTQLVKMVVYAAVGFFSFALTSIPADKLQTFQPFFLVLMAVVAAYIGNSAAQGLALMGLRVSLGKEVAHSQFALWAKHGG